MLDSLVRVSRRAGGRAFRQRRGSRHLAPRSGVPAGWGSCNPRRPPSEWAGRGASCAPRVPAASQPTLTPPPAAGGLGVLLAASASLPAISSPLHSLFKVLFIFPSRYLFAIGLSLMFSFRWSLPPTLSCTRKQLDSAGSRGRAGAAGRVRGCHPLRPPIQWKLAQSRRHGVAPLDYNSADPRGARPIYKLSLAPTSLAVTAGILVSFFSSA